MSPRQKENTRQVFLKRAQAYHSGRVYLHSLYRRRSELDDMLLGDLVELSLSPYTRVRRYVRCPIIIQVPNYVYSRKDMHRPFSTMLAGYVPYYRARLDY